MRLYFTLLFIIELLVCSSIPINEEKMDILNFIKIEKSTDTSYLDLNISDQHKYKYPGLGMLGSFILPGLGQVYAESPRKALLFTSIEAGVWYFRGKTQDDMDSKAAEYKRFADEHWDFGRWVNHYYDHYNNRNESINSFKLYQLFSQETIGAAPSMFGQFASNFEQIIDWNDFNNDGMQDESELTEWNYTHINDGSHSIAFYDPRYQQFKTFPKNAPPTNESNDYFYCEDFNQATFKCNKFSLDLDFEQNLENFVVQKNLHFYENIGKYNQFFMGWDDALFTTEDIEINSEFINIGRGIENFIITASRIDYSNIPPTEVIEVITNEFVYDSEDGNLYVNNDIDSDLSNIQVTYTKASIFNNDGYLVPKSPNKWTYRDLRDDYNQLGKLVGYTMTALMFNRVISMIDAIITVNFYNRKYIIENNLSIEPVFEKDSKIGVGGIKISYRF